MKSRVVRFALFTGRMKVIIGKEDENDNVNDAMYDSIMYEKENRIVVKLYNQQIPLSYSIV